MNKQGERMTWTRGSAKFWIGVAGVGIALGAATSSWANNNVKVSRFWHNHQPLYWPEWNSNGPQNKRVQFAWDSIVLKSGQIYDSSRPHPENDLNAIFGVDDRKRSYQSGPRDSVASVNQGGYAMSYSGSLMNNVQNLAANNQLGYGGNWWNGNREARTWTASDGGPKMDLVGFTYHHSLGAVLPKSVFRKEIQIFHEGAYKAWNTGGISNRSKGFFPTEMGFSRHMIDVLADEGYEWVIVASHHLSRTSPSYNDKANPQGSYNIFSSPPNKADQIGPTSSTGWWFGTGNVGETAWNLAPFAYQLHKAKYVDPETGAEKTIIMVPSDDVQSYKAGYSGWQKGLIDANIAPFANDPSRPCIVMPSTDGDNAWGGGSSSWDGDAPSLMNNGTYPGVTPQGFVNQFGGAAGMVHIEDGAWIFPESCYGSPQFLKWVEPPVANATATNRVFNTQVDMETPGFATKFYAWAPVIAGANWVETAEQMWTAQNGPGSVAAWKIQDPYNNFVNGADSNPNIVERAWHIYLVGLDSGFNYYGGLGNDDEMKSSLATRRAQELLQTYVNDNKAALDNTPPTVFKPQRFPYNPGWYTFGWFNSIPGNNSALKKMKSEFYIWTHAYDVSGITNIVLKIRKDNDGTNPLNSNQNETFAGGAEVGSWVTIPMTKRVLPSTASALTAAANNSQIEYFSQGLPLANADYYFARIDDSSFPNFRDNLFDYYIEAHDGRGNLSKSDIQHVWVADDGFGGPPPSSASFSASPSDCTPLTVTYTANSGPLSNSVPVKMWLSFNGVNFTPYTMTNSGGGIHVYTVTPVPDNAPNATVYFQNAAETITDNRNGQNWSTTILDCDAPTGPSVAIFSNAPACQPVSITYRPNSHPLQSATQVFAHIGFNDFAIVRPSQPMTKISNNLWRITLVPTNDVTQIDVVFNNGAGTWDNNNGADWAFALNVCAGPELPTGFSITNPPNNIAVGNGTVAYVLEGIGESVVGLLTWTNALTGGSGVTFAGLNWQINSIPLGIGSNVITVTGTNVAASVVTSALDSAASGVYGDGWIDSDNGGFGLGNWQLYTSTTNSSQSGRFIANSAEVNIVKPAWGLYANSGNLSEAKRQLLNPLATGQTFFVSFDNGFIDNGAGAGVAMQNAQGNTLWEFFFNGGDTFYSMSGNTTDVGFTAAGIEVQFWLTGPTNYGAKISPNGGATRTYFGNFNPSTNSAVTLFRVWNNNAGSNSERDVFFNSIMIASSNMTSGTSTSDTVVITRAAGAGDSNGDGVPDSWYNQYGMNPGTPGLGSEDSDNDGMSNWEEYAYDTNPTNAASFNANSIEFMTDGNIMDLRVESPTSTGRLYDVYWATSLLNSTWTPMNKDIAGNLDNSPVVLKITNDAAQRYYRTGAKIPTP
jgi:hypothetical protein